jgi:hypothetical protein
MKSLTICLPDVVFETVSIEAAHQGVDIPNFCANFLADQFLKTSPLGISKTGITQAKTPSVNPKFKVADHFPGFPSGSVSFAQIFADEAQKFPGVEASRIRRGVGFKPNFVFIEYLMSRGGKVGIGVSFYGAPSRHKNPPSILVPGIPAYSRAKIYNEKDLQAILPHIRQSYELKFGI